MNTKCSDDVAICSFLSDFEDLLRNQNLALSYTKFVGLKMKRIKNSYANLISKGKTRLFKLLKIGLKKGRKSRE
jgi:CRP/FNR family transcriptional regulator